MKLPFGKKKTGVAAIEAEIAAFEKRRDELAREADVARVALDAALIARREVMIQGGENAAADRAAADAKIAGAERDMSAALDAAQEIDRRLADARQRHDLARDRDDREQRAAALDRDAAQVELKAKALELAVDALGIALADFVQAIPPDFVAPKEAYGPNACGATPIDAARAIIASGLHVVAFDLFETRSPSPIVPRPIGVEKCLPLKVLNSAGQLTEFLPGVNGRDADVLPTSIAAKSIIVDRLRAQAAALRDDPEMLAAAE